MGKDSLAMFNDDGFHTWKVKVKGYLMKKGLWSVVKQNGETEASSSKGKDHNFSQRDEKALGVLISSLDMTSYIILTKPLLQGKLGKCWSQLLERILNICTQLASIGCNVEEEDKVAILLKALPSKYNHLVLVLKEKEPSPSLENVIHSLQEEDKKVLETPTQEAFMVTKPTFRSCTHCGLKNHEAKDCFKLMKCSKCGRNGHTFQRCQKKNSRTKGKTYVVESGSESETNEDQDQQ
ncbi:hypothetical protein KP509_05G056600 [Ceratopteris richardii]|uniref:CCHC-type domain-containing protein n=1 Tax=Ceratopteris richardii TaxID=49495 RepID=A0A8T2UR77_CERRI|nr:hypothetical protein KP509_05G056600 [Ceratopteris richardii]